MGVFSPLYGDPNAYYGIEERARRHRNRVGAREAAEHRRTVGAIPGASLFGPITRSLSGEEGYVSGPIRDPNWDMYFQALQDQGVSELEDASVGVRGKNKRVRDMPASIYSLLNMDQERSF